MTNINKKINFLVKTFYYFSRAKCGKHANILLCTHYVLAATHAYIVAVYDLRPYKKYNFKNLSDVIISLNRKSYAHFTL